MNAIVEIAGCQTQVTPNKVVTVPRLENNVGDIVQFNKIIMADDSKGVTIGTPYVNGTVSAEVLEHGRTDKVLVFHKKRRKGYQKLNGHRQQYTRIKITDIKL